ncbi:MAG TPA: helix-turn-helix transcriptional regulator [Caldimonas sp.]|jgi:XRE family aerobic/anaerobic benzoate catabolism transcriptional regulator|nr:helix-turn-helix transcriptional regulator [Caldimonas sp.]HEX4235106.1 helix-turn-helix transcriptional regulator [Caldimonas sp.]
MVAGKRRPRASAPSKAKVPKKDPFLLALGERVRLLRARRGLTRKGVAQASGVSERHLANLEYGVGNASILVLQQVAGALDCALAELVGDVTTSTPDWLMLRELLQGRSDADVRRARLALATLFGHGHVDPARGRRLALIGLRGAGKSTLGAMLADALEMPFVELSREIEKIAGCSIREIHDLYGTAAYRRYERRSLDEVVKNHPAAVIATPGGIVAEPATFEQLLAHCTTIWLQTSPEEHMGRVAAQGDTRPMAASREAMDDLRRILAGRAAFYSKADAVLDTSGRSTGESFATLAALAADLANMHETASTA